MRLGFDEVAAALEKPLDLEREDIHHLAEGERPERLGEKAGGADAARHEGIVARHFAGDRGHAAVEAAHIHAAAELGLGAAEGVGGQDARPGREVVGVAAPQHVGPIERPQFGGNARG